MDAVPEAHLFVNLHPADLLDPDLLSHDAPLSQIADRVVLEVTERASLQRVPEVESTVAGLKDMGFQVAIDDLGVGYAGLTSFATLEPQVVKLDITLVCNIDSSQTKRRLVRSVVEACSDLGILVVAEGIETVEEGDTCIELGCDLLQGYLIARPDRAFPKIRW
jgi:EAL domain-containing protein (putative c-di-GMP-specific phosphodiesterase class I)